MDASAVLARAADAARHARTGDHVASLAAAEDGLALWDGAPAPGDGGPLAALRAEREAAHRALERARALALARLGRHGEAAGPLEALAAAHPRDEEVLAELLRGTAATAGPSAALDRYEDHRRRLAEELGTDPGAGLRALYRRLLDERAPRVRHGVAHEPNPLLGRDADVAAVAGLLRAWRVVSVAGPGGLGKTRLAHAVARGAEQRTVHFVPLTGVPAGADPDEVAGAVAAAVGAGEIPAAPGLRADAAALVAAALGPDALLVLDNCEHVVDGAAELAGALVATTRDVRVLTTTRAPLGLSSEAVYALPELAAATAAELFVQRARAARPAADLPDAAVAEICAHLDGLPLAVELAAARVRAMSAADIARALDDRFGLLRGGPRDAPARHRTLHAVVNWSWNLLAPSEREALRLLSVFPGGFTADAARLLGADGALEGLVEQSLLKVADTPAGARFTMLETVREFSALRREEAGDTARAAAGMLAWARAFGAAHHAAIYGPSPTPSLERIRAEQDNLAEAARRARAAGDAEAAAAVLAVLGGLWLIECRYNRVVLLVKELGEPLDALDPAPDFADTARTALVTRTVLEGMLQDDDSLAVPETLRRLPPGRTDTLAGAVALLLCTEPGEYPALRARGPLMDGLVSLLDGYAAEKRGDVEHAVAATERAHERLAAGRAPWLANAALYRLSELGMHTERFADIIGWLEAALAGLRELGAWPDVLGAGWGLAMSHLGLGRVAEAERWLEYARNSGLDDQLGLDAYVAGMRGEIALCRGDVDGALRQWGRAVRWLRDAEAATCPEQDIWRGPWALENLSAAVVAHARAGRLDGVPEVAEMADRLPAMALRLLDGTPPTGALYTADLPVWGVLIVAIGMTARARGDHARAARLIALAERLRFLPNFQPTMNRARARADAEDSDAAAYAAAVTEFAGLDRDSLREAARTALTAP
ncbi:ATP-binding protein [Actinomadura parmotrematis]|uniref:ATP-binding protein n=1 Tax=Actinomadura parmotrematis TaxID=2864039 RepID=UPI0027E2C1E1|nr:BTAD domain-containing putative transcriptional regulator [Actinomadura parmotrematis]